MTILLFGLWFYAGIIAGTYLVKHRKGKADYIAGCGMMLSGLLGLFTLMFGNI